MPLVSFIPDDLEKGFFSDINKYNADNNPSVNLVQEPLNKTFTETAEIVDCINKNRVPQSALYVYCHTHISWLFSLASPHNIF